MSKGDFDSPQRETTDAYRDNWERLWGALWGEEKPAATELCYPNGCPILNEDFGTDQSHGETA